MLIAILARGDLRSTISLWGPSTQIGTCRLVQTERKNQNGRFSVRNLVPRMQRNRLSPVECSVGNRFPDPMAIGHPGRLLEFKQGVLLWLTDCQRSTVFLCLGRLLESPGFGYRLPPRLPQPLLCSGRPVNLKGLVILSAWAWKSLNPLGRDWKIERKVRTLYGCQIYDVRHNRLFRAKASRTIVVVCDHQRLPGQRASSRDPNLG